VEWTLFFAQQWFQWLEGDWAAEQMREAPGGNQRIGRPTDWATQRRRCCGLHSTRERFFRKTSFSCTSACFLILVNNSELLVSSFFLRTNFTRVLFAMTTIGLFVLGWGGTYPLLSPPKLSFVGSSFSRFFFFFFSQGLLFTGGFFVAPCFTRDLATPSGDIKVWRLS